MIGLFCEQALYRRYKDFNILIFGKNIVFDK